MRHVAALILAFALAAPAPVLAGGLEALETEPTHKIEVCRTQNCGGDDNNQMQFSRRGTVQDHAPDWLAWWLGIIFGQDRQSYSVHSDAVQP